MKKGHKIKNNPPKVVPDFIQVPYQVFTNEKLSSTDKFVYGAIYFFYSTTAGKRCTASNETLGDLIKTSPTTVANSLIKLEENRFIRRIYFDETRRRRKEIIPIVVVSKLIKNKHSVSPMSETPVDYPVSPMSETNEPKRVSSQSETVSSISETKKSKRVSSQSETVSSQSETVSSQSETPKIDKKESDLGLNKAKSVSKKPKRVSLQSEEREKEERITRENNKKEISFLSSTKNELVKKEGRFTDHLESLKKYKSIEDIPKKLADNSLALLLPLFPNEFVVKKVFAIESYRTAMKGILMTTDYDELKIIIEKYHAAEWDKYRPGCKGIFDFCRYQFATIKAYTEKSSGGLYAQKPISSPEESKVRDIQYQSIIEKADEETRLAKEKWQKEQDLKNKV